MKVIIEKKQIISNIIGKQPFDNNKDYRFLKYIFKVYADSDLLLFNMITGQLVTLDSSEQEQIKLLLNDDNLIKELIELWYIVPNDFDDEKFANSVTDTKKILNKLNNNNCITSFEILPTTDCNARCFYCFELSGKRKNMSDDTANKVVDYIEKKSKGNDICLKWFGGEPLYNSRAIDIICDELFKRNINFFSHMNSNGYLFDADAIKKAVNLWNLKWVQITLDGTEEIYNKIKAYIYKNDISPFKKVLSNIEELLKNGIAVSVRMNMDEYNDKDLFELVDLLYDLFGKYANFDMYSNLLFEDSTEKINMREKEQRQSLISKHLKLQDYIREKNCLRTYYINNNGGDLAHCMADSDNMIIIYPDGKLGKCQHYTDDHFVGDIFTEKMDYDMINWYKEIRLVNDDCKKCYMMPWCFFPVCCLSVPNRCDSVDKMLRNQILHDRILNTYKKHIKEHSDET